MKLGDLFEQAIGLGESADPRPVAVSARRSTQKLEIRSTPGARIRLERDGWSGDTQVVLLACLRLGVPVELVESAPGSPSRILLDGSPLTALELRARLRDGLR
jgi:hypothetical protein